MSCWRCQKCGEVICDLNYCPRCGWMQEDNYEKRTDREFRSINNSSSDRPLSGDRTAESPGGCSVMGQAADSKSVEDSI